MEERSNHLKNELSYRGDGKVGVFQKIFAPPHYSSLLYKNKVFAGWEKPRMEPHFMDFSSSARLALIAPTGGGKSFVGRGIMDRVAKFSAVAVMCDIKDEFYTSERPVQEQFEKLLGEGEHPTGLPIRVFTPRFLKIAREKQGKPTRGESLQFSLMDLDAPDIMTFLGVESNEITKMTLIETIHDKIRTGEFHTVEEIIEYINETDIPPPMKMNMRFALKRLVDSGVIGEESEGNTFVEALIAGQIPVLNLKGYEDVNEHWAKAYVGILTRHIKQAKENGLIRKPLYLYYPETPRFVPANGNPCCKEEIFKIAEVGRQLGISMFFEMQSVLRVDPNILKQCKYIYIHSRLHDDEKKIILKACGLYEYQDYMYNVWTNFFGKLKQHDWCLIAVNTHEYWALKVPAPLSAHCLESRWQR